MSSFVIRPIYPLPYNLRSQYLVHTLIMMGTCQPGIFYLTLTSLSWFTDYIKCQVFVIRSVSLLEYILDSSYLIHTLIMDGIIYIFMHVSLTKFQFHATLYFGLVYFLKKNSHILQEEGET